MYLNPHLYSCLHCQNRAAHRTAPPQTEEVQEHIPACYLSLSYKVRYGLRGASNSRRIAGKEAGPVAINLSERILACQSALKIPQTHSR